MSPSYLADTSAATRHRLPDVDERLGPLLEDGELHTCAIVDLELLYTARSHRDYERILWERRGLPDAPITPAVMKRAIEIQHKLAAKGQHRCPWPDLIVAAAAEAAGLTVLHYDPDFDRIADVAGVRQEWVVKRGSAD